MISIRSVGILLVMLVWGAALQAATVSIVPSSQTIYGDLGASFEVTISIDGLADSAAPSLGAYDITLSYDASILTYGGTAFDSTQMDLGGGSFAQATSAINSVNLVELSFELPAVLDSQQAASFTLAVLTFYTANYGSSALNLGGIVLGDALGDALVVSSVNGSVNVTQVPLPGVVFYPSALLALAWLRRRRLCFA